MATKPKAPGVNWQLVQVDGQYKGTVILGQFMAEEYREDVTTTWAAISIPKRAAPVDQWIRGDTRSATFNAKLFDTTGQGNLDAAIALLERATQQDLTLGRPPLFRFVWGSLSYDCVVESLGDVRYDEVWNDGRIKGVVFTIRLRRQLDPLVVQATDPSKPPHLSLYKPALDGDTYEAMAARQYGDPDLGVYLRQDAKLVQPQPGAIVHLPPASYYAGRTLAPRTYALGDSDAPAARRRALLDAYGGATTLPYVVQG
jgi:hypothetical protein